jgi:hypothetical protein
MVDKIGPDNYSNLLGHVDKVAATFGIPLWAPAGAWRDEYFRDIHAHANVQGRYQFQEKLGHWYKARQ